MQIKKAPIFLINLALFFCPTFCAQTPVQFTTKHNLLLTALPRESEAALYKFDGTFYADRIEQLEYIGEEGGSMQSNDALEYGEFLKLREGKNFKEKTIEKFENAVKEMDAKIEQIWKENPILGAKLIEIGKFRTELDKEILDPSAVEEPKLHRLVLNCKQFMRRLMSEEGEGSWVDIYSFMGAGEKRYGTALRNIYELATIQSAKLDELINEAMWQEHQQNHRRGTTDSGGRLRHDKRRVLVEGAGPVGLFSAFHLFLAGAHVTVLNDRPEQYTRNHMTFLDAKFVAQFRFFLGTKFDELYTNEKALGRINTLGGEVGQQNVKVVEQSFKERLIALATFVEGKIGGEGPSRLKLLYQTELKGVKRSANGKGFEAIVKVTQKMNPDQTLFNENRIKKRAELRGIDLATAKEQIIEEMAKNILKRRALHGATALGDKSDRTECQAKMELEGQSPALRRLAPIPFDILFCAGGANDRIRDKLLGKPLRRSVTKNYGLAVFEKGNRDERVFDHLTGFFNIKMSDFEPILREQNFDAFVEKQKGILSNKFVRRYRNLTQLIVRGMARQSDKYAPDDVDKRHTKPIYKRRNGRFVLADPNEDPRQIVRLFENRPSVHIASITPPAVEEFVRDIKREWHRSAKEPLKQKRINEVRLRFERKWSAAIFDLCLRNAHPEKVGKITVNLDADGVPGEQISTDGLNIDPLPYNTSIFALTIFAVQNAVKVMDYGEKGKGANGKPSAAAVAIIAAIGDANTSPHFMTTSGLSLGRLGVEWSAYALRDYHQGKITEKELIDRMSERLNSIERRVVKKVQEYVTIEGKEGEQNEQASHLDKSEDKVFKAIYHPQQGHNDK